jgi:hypothetical protein
MPPTRLTLAFAAAALLALTAAPAANAGLLAASGTDCTPEVLENPFVQWGDYADYVRLPGGSFEAGDRPWSLSRASVVTDNESYQVGGRGDRRSLSIGSGGSAQSATLCVGTDHPTLRFFARNTGSAVSALGVSVNFVGPLGVPLSAPIGTVAGDAGWSPTAPILIVANLLPLLPGETTPVSFTFAPAGLGASWRIDDVYVDPYRKG